MERRLQSHQAKIRAHKTYLLDVVNSHWVLIVTTLIPGFLMGWKMARERGIFGMLKPLFKMALMAFVPYVKQQALLPRARP
jgi:hypothetical protein